MVQAQSKKIRVRIKLDFTVEFDTTPIFKPNIVEACNAGLWELVEKPKKPLRYSIEPGAKYDITYNPRTKPGF